RPRHVANGGGILAELERSLIQERTKAGRAAATARGVKMGRKPKLSPQQVAHARQLREQGQRSRQIGQLLKVSERTAERALSTEESILHETHYRKHTSQKAQKA